MFIWPSKALSTHKSHSTWCSFERVTPLLILSIWMILGAVGLRGDPNMEGLGNAVQRALGESMHLAHTIQLRQQVVADASQDQLEPL